METKVYAFADKEFHEVVAFNGKMLDLKDKDGWVNSIPITRVERFCDKEGKHIYMPIEALLKATE